MNESEKKSSAEEDELSLNASSSVSVYESSNITDSSVMMDAENNSCCEEPLIMGEISDGGNTVSLNNDNIANCFDNEHNINDEVKSVSATETHNLYEELVILYEYKLVENKDAFKCEFCLNICEPKAGVILSECIHSICKECIIRIVKTTNDIEIKCPYKGANYICDMIIPHHEIKEIVSPEVFDVFIQRSLTVITGADTLNNDVNGNDVNEICEKVLKRPLPVAHVIDTALYEELMVLDDQLLVENKQSFNCEVCLNTCEPKAGIIISECLHAFCKQCIATLVEMATDVEIHCPYRDSEYSCDNVILHREIKQVVSPEVFDKFLEKSVCIAMHSMSDARNCQFPDCKGWICIDEKDGNNTFTCSICKRINCVLCKGLHDPQVISCEEYKRTLNNPNQFSENLLRNMVNSREAMLCPTCGVVIKKVSGCDGIICIRCKTEICWATRGPRWGPRGKGDTSGGCRCNLNGSRCHPNCTNCH